MAVQKNNVLMHGTSGSFSRLITFKQYNGRTIVSHYPDMSKVVYTKAQIAERFRFKQAVAYARAVIADPQRKKTYAKKAHISAYHAAISEYIRASKAEEQSQKTMALPAKEPAVIEKVEPAIRTASILIEDFPVRQDTAQPPS